eukprot:586175-Prorocentrum_minimum.AAC.1
MAQDQHLQVTGTSDRPQPAFFQPCARIGTVLASLAIRPTTACRVNSDTTSITCPRTAGVFQSIPG